MFYKYQIIAAILLVIIIGFIRIVYAIKGINKKIVFLDEYKANFITLITLYINSSSDYATRNFNELLCSWVFDNTAKAQSEVEMNGIGEFVAAFQIYKIRNYQFIVNTIAKIKEGEISNREINKVDNILTRCLGAYEKCQEDLLGDLKNPLKWFQYGVQWLLSLPVRILYWFGLLNNKTVERISASYVFKFISVGIGLISFLSAIIIIIKGWDAFNAIIQKLF